MIRPFATRSIALSLCAVLGACAGSGDRYPSLAIRDAERAQGQFTPATPAPPPVAPVASAGDIASLVASARQAHGRFLELRPRTARLVSAARGGGIDNSARQIALVALAELTSIRSDTQLPMAELDLLQAEAATTFAPLDVIDAAHAEVSAIVSEEDEVLDSLARQLGV